MITFKRMRVESQQLETIFVWTGTHGKFLHPHIKKYLGNFDVCFHCEVPFTGIPYIVFDGDAQFNWCKPCIINHRIENNKKGF